MGVYTCHGHDALHCGKTKMIPGVVFGGQYGSLNKERNGHARHNYVGF